MMARLIALVAALLVTQAHNEDGIVQRERKKAEAAQKTLEKSPDDPEANEMVGRFQCFILDDWAKGLPFLGKAKDADLRTLAAKDLRADPADASVHTVLGDEWWKLASRLKGTEAKNAAGRAVHWYRRALPKLPKEARPAVLIKLDKYLTLIGPAIVKIPANAKWTDTGIDLFDEERISFTVAGKWCINNNPDMNAWCDWKGYALMRSKQTPMPAKPCCCLIARIGEDEPFAVHDFPNLAVCLGGRLYLGPNASPGDDVPGEIVVTLRRSLR